MAQLSIAELSKQFSGNHPLSGKMRYTVLVDKIKSGSPFDLTKNRKKVLFYASKSIKTNFERGNLKPLKGNQRLFKDMDNKIVRIDELEKTAEFGGGGGSGAGSDLTELVESAQCLYCALVFNVFKRPLKVDEVITPAQFKRAATTIDVDSKFDEMVNDLPEEWVKSSILGANKLYSKYRGQSFIFHRGSSDIEIIEDTFKSINRDERAFGDINKWSPADIYMIKRNVDLRPIKKEHTLKGLNGYLLNLYNANKCIGVSLKKIVSRAKYSEINLYENKGTKDKVSYKGYIVKANENSTLYDSNDGYIRYGTGNQERIQLRSFASGSDNPSQFQGEVKGETANQGKVSLGPMSFILKQHTKTDVSTSASITQAVKRNDDFIYRDLYDRAKKLGVKNLPEDFDEHKVKCDEKGLKWKYSKYLALEVITLIENQTKEVQDKIMKDIYFYASSQSSFSAVFAKIEG